MTKMYKGLLSATYIVTVTVSLYPVDQERNPLREEWKDKSEKNQMMKR